MSKIIIMQGLPASGKSTLAQEILKSDGNAVRINKDLIRTMLHFDRWSGKNESITRDASRTLAKHFLAAGKNVIIDDTNLNEHTLQSWKDLARESNAKIEYERLDTPMEECLLRDAARPNKVGRHVIVGMAMQNGLYPKPKTGFVICDLDGTLCDIRHRLHFVKRPEGEKKDWKSFFAEIPNDTPRSMVVTIIMDYIDKGHELFLVSGRPDTYRKETENWIANLVPYKALFMRRADDKRPDTEVKSDILRSHFKDYSLIKAVIDDRPSVIRMWKEQGLNVIDVGDGTEF